MKLTILCTTCADSEHSALSYNSQATKMDTTTPNSKYLRLYDWHDKELKRPLHEVPVLRIDQYNRNGKERLLVWSADPDEFNFVVFPTYGTAYPEYDNIVQQQRYARRYLFEFSDSSLDETLDTVFEGEL